MPAVDEAVFKKAVRSIFRHSGFTVEMMATRQVRALVDEYVRVLNAAVRPALESGVVPEAMARRLKEDVFVFSGFKTYRNLKEASCLLCDGDGTVKPFYRFYNDIAAIKENYNRHWLKSEYVFAEASAEMAARWKEFEADGDRYDLQYRTAHDGKVRAEHRVLHGVTLPASDPFWDEFFPPNGWRCRCTVVQVRKGKYPLSDSATAIQQGREATQQIGKNGVNRAEMFRFNPGKQQVVFPKHHPYYNVSQREREALREVLRPEEKEYMTVATDNGKVRIHNKHGKNEKRENTMVSGYFANKYGYEIDLLPRDDDKPCADAFNRTLGYEEEYKVNTKPTANAIDAAIRSAKRQADHIVLWIDSDITYGDLTDGIKDRIRRSENVKTITIVRNGKDHTYTREDILRNGFKIQQADLE